MDKIYLVCVYNGGMYEDARSFNVGYFTTEEEAESYIENKNKETKYLYERYIALGDRLDEDCSDEECEKIKKEREAIRETLTTYAMSMYEAEDMEYYIEEIERLK